MILPAIAPTFGGRETGAETSLAMAIVTTIGKIALFGAGMFVIGKRVIPAVLGRVARTGSRELFTLGILGTALGVAFGAQWVFAVSPALGAFVAGVIISETDLSYQAGAETLPLQETFTVLFFVAVGMLFDPSVIVSAPIPVLLALFIVMVLKSVAAAALVLLFRYPFATAILIAASLAQIGEFSFILAALAVQLEILSETARSIVIAVAVISIGLNSLVLRTVEPIDRWVQSRPRLLKLLERPRRGRDRDVSPDAHDLSGHVVMIGYGRVGEIVGEALLRNRIKFAVVELDRSVVLQLRAAGIHAVFGDAARPGILTRAHIRSARMLVIATPGRAQAIEIVQYAKRVNRSIHIVARTHHYEDEQLYSDLGVSGTVMGERELGLQLAHYALVTSGRTEKDADRTIARLREDPTSSL
ncbi:MAG: cation:proton antiporter [Fimbriimonadales bacterium]